MTISNIVSIIPVFIDLEQAKKDWHETAGPFQVRKIAEHYGIFEHLFGKYAFFTPRVPLDIKYKITGDSFSPVYHGNYLKPSEAKEAPTVSFDPNFSFDGREPKSKENSLWTLVMTNPDGHFNQEDSEYVHWMVANIPNNDIGKGETIVPYLQPFPPKGTGFHRHIFILYKQDQKIDLNQYRVDDSKDLDKRTFKTLDFYRNLQDVITPAGLAFFQSDWDKSLTDFYHNVLDRKEPIYEYDFPKPYIKDQKFFPLKQPFNLYMDKYRDPKQVHKEYLEKKLAKTHPFDGPGKPLRFPNAHPIKGVPSWLKTEIKKDRLRWGRINDV
jgi:large subunit ribosomal protein L38